MEYRDEKRRLIHSIVKSGVDRHNFVEHANEIGVAAPPELLAKWQKRFYSTPKFELPESPRLINRFCVGADPEFVFGRAKQLRDGTWDVKYSHAERLGLTTLEAFGCDMSGRQAELRAYPSRFVLEVVASLADTLRWCAEALPAACEWDWLAPAYFVNDGIGGHVHIGRKRKVYVTDIKSLNFVNNTLLGTAVFDNSGQIQRLGNTAYGRMGDYRAQAHGYEYRTMPTWLYSPWAAYLTLVLSKLAVFHNAGITCAKAPPTSEVIKNLLRSYQCEDDDARIALHAINVLGMPQYVAGDFRKAWGIPVKSSGTLKWNKTYFPTTIKPEVQTVQELFDFLMLGNAIKARVPKPTWEPFILPDKSYKLQIAPHSYGLPEVGQGMLCKGIKVMLQRGNPNRIDMGCPFGLSLDKHAIRMRLKTFPTLRRMALSVSESFDDTLTIMLPKNIHDDHVVNKNLVRDLREFLGKSGLLPVTFQDGYNTLDPTQFFEVQKKVAPFIGRMLDIVNGEAVPVRPKPIAYKVKFDDIGLEEPFDPANE